MRARFIRRLTDTCLAHPLASSLLAVCVVSSVVLVAGLPQTIAIPLAALAASALPAAGWQYARRNLERETPTAETPLPPGVRALVQRLIDVIPHAVFLKDGQRRYLLVNETFARERGLAAEDIVGRRADELNFGEVAAMVLAEDARILAGEPVLKEEAQHHPVTGEECWRVVAKARAQVAENAFVIVGSHFDITRWHNAERALQAEHDRQKALRERTQVFIQRMIDVIPDPVYVKDANSRFLLVNQAFGRERGLPAEKIVGLTSFDLTEDEETRKLVAREDAAVMAGGEIYKEQHARHPVSGREVFRIVSKRLCYDADNRPVIVGAHFDLTRWRVAERNLQDALQRAMDMRERVSNYLQRLIDVIPQPVYVKNAEGRYLQVNEAFAAERGVPRNEIVGTLAADHSAEDAEVVQGRFVYREEEQCHPVTGAEQHRVISKRPCEDEMGQTVIVGANFDITPWRIAERALQGALAREKELRQRVQAYMQRLIDVIPVSIYVKDRESRYLMVNQTLLRQRQVSAESLIGRAPDEIDHDPRWLHVVLDEDRRVFAGETVYKEECRPHRITGEPRFRLVAKGSCEDAEGQPVIVVANIDITDLRTAEQRARQALDAQSHVREFLQSLIGALPNPLYVEDAEGRLLMVNRAFRHLTGQNGQEIVGQPTAAACGPEGLRQALARCHAQIVQLEDGHIYETEFQFENAAGATRHYMLRATNGHGIEGQAVVVGVLSDVTTQREAEARGLLAKEEAERANQAKSLFLAGMSHEIRTPLAGVIGTLRIALREGDLPAHAHDMINASLENAESLLAIINDILDFSKIEAGQLSLESIDFDLRALAAECLRVLQHHAQSRSLQLIIDIDPKLPAYFRGDPTRIRQILINLVGNAVKFTECGSIALRATSLGESEGRHRVRFRVEDTGIGIPPDALPRLFGKFQQADTSTTRRYGGTGLGLAICRELVEAMGGEIGVTSKPGVGTTFEFLLPLEPGQAPRAADETPLPRHAKRLRVLCAEDYPTNQLIIRTLLEDMGHEVDVAENGREAILALSLNDYDVVLMDGRMPELDGADATRAIRTGGLDGRTVRNPRIPIVALTANASTEERDGYMAAGMDDFLTKPIELPKLHAVLSRVIDRLPPEAPDMPPASTGEEADDRPPRCPEGVSETLHKRLLGMFAASIPTRLQDLARLEDGTDLKTLANLAHGICGSAGMVGADALSRHAGILERAARREDKAEALQLVPGLRIELERLQARLDAGAA